MLYGSETWEMKQELESKLETTDMRMIRRISRVSLRDKKKSAELRSRLGVEAIGEVCRRNRLRWFGHVERKDDKDWVKKVTRKELKVDEDKNPKGRPHKTWRETVNGDMKSLGLREGDAQDRDYWRDGIHGAKRLNPGIPGKPVIHNP